MSSSRPMNAAEPPRVKGFARGEGRSADVLLLALLVCAVALATGGFLWRQARVKAAHARIDAAWVQAQKPMVARLHQPRALEYGDVWATHTGVICGSVNGWGSFGGLSAMTPFYVWKDKAFFALDMTALAFAPGWRECLGDHWVDLVKDGRAVAPHRRG